MGKKYVYAYCTGNRTGSLYCLKKCNFSASLIKQFARYPCRMGLPRRTNTIVPDAAKKAKIIKTKFRARFIISISLGVRAMEDKARVLQTMRHIDKNLTEPFSLDGLAGMAHLSKYHYHRLFHKVAGESVAKYISRRRMEIASYELLSTDQPIIDIALKYQYGSQEAFSRAFKRVHGVMPGQYRRIHGARRVQSGINAMMKLAA